MTLTITSGYWLIPAVITLVCLFQIGNYTPAAGQCVAEECREARHANFVAGYLGNSCALWLIYLIAALNWGIR